MSGRLAVVVGASGGLGRAFVARLATEPGWSAVVGVGRARPDDWPEDPRTPFLALDLLDETALAALAAQLRERGSLSLLLITTGLLHGADLTPEKSMRAVSASAMQRLFEVNTIIPSLVLKHLTPLLPKDEPSLVAALSARVGSIGDNRLGGWHAYRASKAALNMMIRCQALELQRERPRAVCVVLHPGTVATELSAPFARSPKTLFTPDDAAQRLLKVLSQLEPAQSGGFFAHDGQPIPW